MKVYISGPITGTTDYMERFKRAERRIRAAGHEVVNPAAVNSALPASTTYEEYMTMSITMLDMCNAVYVLEGWEKSKGSNMEITHALHTGKMIEFEKGEGICVGPDRQERESLALKRDVRSWKEIWESAFSARKRTI